MALVTDHEDTQREKEHACKTGNEVMMTCHHDDQVVCQLPTRDSSDNEDQADAKAKEFIPGLILFLESG